MISYPAQVPRLDTILDGHTDMTMFKKVGHDTTSTRQHTHITICILWMLCKKII